MRILKKQSWPYRVRVYSRDKTTLYETWLEENVGVICQQWNVVYRVEGSDYYFRNHSDAMLFTLRWA